MSGSANFMEAAGGRQSEERANQGGNRLDREQRIRRTWADAGPGRETPSDWMSFDIGRTARALKVSTEAQANVDSPKVACKMVARTDTIYGQIAATN